VRGLVGVRENGALRPTSNLRELLVQQPEVLGEGMLSIILGNLIRLTQEEVLPIPFELFGGGSSSMVQTITCEPYLFLHDVQPVLLDLEILDLFKYVTQEDWQLVVVSSDDKVRPERMRCIVIRESCEIGVVRELGQGITNEVREEPRFHVQGDRMVLCRIGIPCHDRCLRRSVCVRTGRSLDPSSTHVVLPKHTCEYRYKPVLLAPSIDRLFCTTTARVEFHGLDEGALRAVRHPACRRPNSLGGIRSASEDTVPVCCSAP